MADKLCVGNRARPRRHAPGGKRRLLPFYLRVKAEASGGRRGT
ncbi:MAG: hypothetical protein ACLUE1_01220 [Adlercreutzia equolifaciens]